jgi:predicted nucleic acid-binding protein
VALIVLDASIAIAGLNAADALHAAAVEAFDRRSDDDLRLPASAYAEALVHPARAGVADAARAKLVELAVVVEALGPAAAERAAGLRVSIPALRLPDALVLGCAYELGADEILTADRRWAGLDRVTVLG